MRSRVWRWLALGAFFAGWPAWIGCGARPLGALVAPDGGANAREGGAPDAGRAVCPAPAGCNDDPTTSALAGACTDDGAGGYYCVCADGFSPNPKTGLCRAGSSCVAAAADEWPFRLALDTTDCASRPVTACDAPASDRQSLILAKLGRLSSSSPTCSLPELLTVRVELVDGCATLLEGRGLHGVPATIAPYELTFLECFAAELEATRFACGGASDCFMAEWDTIVP